MNSPAHVLPFPEPGEHGVRVESESGEMTDSTPPPMQQCTSCTHVMLAELLTPVLGHGRWCDLCLDDARLDGEV